MQRDWNLKYRRDGTPYPAGDEGLLAWCKDMENPKIKIVKQNKLWNGMFVSTVWLGLNHAYGGGKPLIFETMVFGVKCPWKKHSTDYEQERYSTEADALEGHEKYVRMYSHPLYPYLLLGRWLSDRSWKIKLKFIRLKEWWNATGKCEKDNCRHGKK